LGEYGIKYAKGVNVFIYIFGTLVTVILVAIKIVLFPVECYIRERGWHE
jgi:hypothetical protein